MEKLRIIYALVDPFTRAVRYVGASKNPRMRLSGHISRAKRNDTPGDKQTWLLELLKAGKRPLLQELEHVNEAIWEEAEQRWISFYQAQGMDGLDATTKKHRPKLLNVTAGGQGTRTMPAEARARAAETRKRNHKGFGAERNAKISAAHTGKTRSTEHRAAISASLKGRAIPDATRAASIEAQVKTFKLEYRDGHFETVTNLREYCRVNRLSHSTLYGVKSGRRKSYRGIIAVHAD